MNRNHGSKPFKTLIGRRYGSTDYGTPQNLRTTAVTYQVITNARGSIQGNIGLDNNQFYLPFGTINVADNDFSTGPAVIVLGEYQFISGEDYQKGLTAGATATNIAAAIAKLPDFAASANGTEVLVSWSSGSFDEVDFKVMHQGTKVNFTLANTTGYLSIGSPLVVSPTLE